MDFEDRRDPWDTGVYQTGSTKPPKSHGKLIAVLLSLVIFLGGIASFLGVLNVRLLRQQQPGTPDNTVAVFQSEPSQATEPEQTESSVSPTADRIQLDLSQSPVSVDNVPQEGGLSLQAIYAKAIDSVASISCAVNGGSASGTGVVLSAGGYIVTNCHVVADARSIQVQLTDGRTFAAQVVGQDAISDLAVLYVDADDLTPAEFGDSSALRVGDAVAAIGDPLGVELRGTLTDGIVSAINRDIVSDGRTMTLIQTNCALNEGNSGGPLLNCYGQVIGINTMKIGDYGSSAGVEGLGFAIPSTTVKEIVDQLISQGYVSGRPTLGLEGESVSVFYQMYYRLPKGLYLTEVEEDSAAAAAGVREGDILVSLDGQSVPDSDRLAAILSGYSVGDTVSAVVYRSGRQYSLELIITESKG